MLSRIIRDLHPAWNALVMSLAGIGLAGLFDPLTSTNIDGLVSASFLMLATALFMLLLLATGVRRWVHRDAWQQDAEHPQFGPLLAGLPAAALVLSVGLGELMVQDQLPVQLPYQLISALVVFGVLGTIFFGVSFFSIIINKSDWPVPMLSGTWFIPVVPFVLLPSGLARLTELEVGSATTYTFLAAAAWGSGFILFLLLAAAIGHRLLTQPAPPAHAIASWWIWLAPMNAGGLGLLGLSSLVVDVPGATEDAMVFQIVATFLYGFGLWWFIFSAVQTWKHKADIHFHLGLWGMGFPLAAFSALSHALSVRWGIVELQWLASTTWIALLVYVTLMLILTIKGIFSGKVFQRA